VETLDCASCLNADVRNLDSIEGARILVGEEVRSLSATVAEAGGGADDGWLFNAGGGAISKLGFCGLWTGSGLAVRRCDEAAVAPPRSRVMVSEWWSCQRGRGVGRVVLEKRRREPKRCYTREAQQ
jgi:hypothetical protein